MNDNSNLEANGAILAGKWKLLNHWTNVRIFHYLGLPHLKTKGSKIVKRRLHTLRKFSIPKKIFKKFESVLSNKTVSLAVVK
jgi:hypothetical protein